MTTTLHRTAMRTLTLATLALVATLIAACGGSSNGPPCVNGFQDAGETGIDCGGVCGLCPDALCEGATACASLNCTQGTCAAATCTDGIFNGQEQDTDCGGPCRACTTVVPGACANGVQDGAETGVDCGGSCVACGVEDRCSNGVQDTDEDNVDCGGPCAACGGAPSCDDNIRNQGEAGVDCGGPCEACAVVDTCVDGLQNQGEAGVDCGGPCDACTGAETCSDGVQNQDEEGVDCGGPCEEECGTAETCNDGLRNQGEEGVDCGGPCESCPVEPTCNDEVRNGNESDVDCGGSGEGDDEGGERCARCGEGQRCGTGGDCASNTCDAGLCVTPFVPSCAESRSCMLMCELGDSECPSGCVTSMPSAYRAAVFECISLVCDSEGDPACGLTGFAQCVDGRCGEGATCSDGVQNGPETDLDCGGGCPRCANGKDCEEERDCENTCYESGCGDS
ncbi:MAG: hypothetical protein ACI9MR_002098 [Myxococcota bacterium]|jgi:hypothetical protein